MRPLTLALALAVNFAFAGTAFADRRFEPIPGVTFVRTADGVTIFHDPARVIIDITGAGIVIDVTGAGVRIGAQDARVVLFDEGSGALVRFGGTLVFRITRDGIAAAVPGGATVLRANAARVDVLPDGRVYAVRLSSEGNVSGTVGSATYRLNTNSGRLAYCDPDGLVVEQADPLGIHITGGTEAGHASITNTPRGVVIDLTGAGFRVEIEFADRDIKSVSGWWQECANGKNIRVGRLLRRRAPPLALLPVVPARDDLRGGDAPVLSARDREPLPAGPRRDLALVGVERPRGQVCDGARAGEPRPADVAERRCGPPTTGTGRSFGRRA